MFDDSETFDEILLQEDRTDSLNARQQLRLEKYLEKRDMVVLAERKNRKNLIEKWKKHIAKLQREIIAIKKDKNLDITQKAKKISIRKKIIELQEHSIKDAQEYICKEDEYQKLVLKKLGHIK